MKPKKSPASRKQPSSIQTVQCPTCGKESAWKNNKFRPFCSERCKLIDLGDWADEKHRVAGENADLNQSQDNLKNNED